MIFRLKSSIYEALLLLLLLLLYYYYYDVRVLLLLLLYYYYFDVRVCHLNVESYRDLEPQQIYCLRENEKKRQYLSRVLDIEHGTFTPLIFTTTGATGKECLNYHSRQAELIAMKKGEDYAKTTQTTLKELFLEAFKGIVRDSYVLNCLVCLHLLFFFLSAFLLRILNHCK